MKTATIIVDDGTVVIDGVAVIGLDMSLVPAGIHAVQWDAVNGSGEIEYQVKRCDSCGVSSKKPNLTINDFSPFQSLVDAHAAAISAQAAPPADEPVA